MEDLEKMKDVVLMMLTVTGCDITGPDEFVETITDIDAIRAVSKVLSDNKINKRDFIRGLIINELKPSDIFGLLHYVNDDVKSKLDFMTEHPDYREKPSFEDFMKSLKK